MPPRPQNRQQAAKSARLEQALRANLKRRKEGQRADHEAPDAIEAPAPDDGGATAANAGPGEPET
ncbi:MAG: hypothetical protein SH859_12175 [Hyphomicrobium aestuarii]|nr:hypothetical protein [Hyphomicrobium aestuarii]